MCPNVLSEKSQAAQNDEFSTGMMCGIRGEYCDIHAGHGCSVKLGQPSKMSMCCVLDFKPCDVDMGSTDTSCPKQLKASLAAPGSLVASSVAKKVDGVAGEPAR